ncbi:protein of unknown function [Georgenia satyanarayanai]|uniref:DUF222 domain-containing protein n=1 Tax=Georgenia satyanarayanai TaxID=860221 RepID=A0A2Y8ZW89_9MICO|nr:HNH endonuclease signature motif containing protein [Georgenia satyanarayanai]PYG01801.1 uncharacterized protein DUF222 [Georgenia satyanarayanai]SSA36601.1 protein of unknown function [Georgenia satyanarayanai]
MNLEGDGTQPERSADVAKGAGDVRPEDATADRLEEMLPGRWPTVPKPIDQAPALARDASGPSEGTPEPAQDTSATAPFGPVDSPAWPRDLLAELIPQDGALGDYLAPLPPGPVLGIVLAAIDPADVDDYSLVELTAAHKRMEAYAAAQAVRSAAVLAERPALNPEWPGTQRGRTRGECLAGHELAMRLKISKVAGTRMAATGRALGGLLEATGEALERGLIDYPRAQAIVTRLDGLPPEVALAAQWEVIDTAPGRTLRQLTDDLEKAVISVDPDEADARHRAARQKRTVYHPRALPDGMASMTALLPAADAIALDITLDSAARAAKHAGDGRTMDQLRADSLSLMAHGALISGFIGVPAEAQVAPSLDPTAGQSADGEATDGAASAVGAYEGPALPTGAPTAGADAEPTPPTGDPGPAREGAAVPVDEPASGSEERALPTSGTEAEPPVQAPPAKKRARPAKGTQVPYGAAPPVPGQRLPQRRMPAVRLGTVGGLPVEVRLDVPLAVGLPDLNVPPRNALERDPEPVAVLEGYGPIAPEVARALAAGGQWRRIVSDPVTGQVLDVGRTRYAPPAAMADLVRERDKTCIEPGCSTPAHKCQLDHIHEWQDGGETSVWNLGPQCDRTHAVKSQGGFTVARASDGTYAWTTMTGHGYLRRTDGTVITMPRRTAAGLRAVGKEIRRSGKSVPVEVVDTVLAEVAAGSSASGGWTPPPLPQRSFPVGADDPGPAWDADDEPPF